MFAKRCNNCSTKIYKNDIFVLEGKKLCKECYDFFIKNKTMLEVSKNFSSSLNKTIKQSHKSRKWSISQKIKPKEKSEVKENSQNEKKEISEEKEAVDKNEKEEENSVLTKKEKKATRKKKKKARRKSSKKCSGKDKFSEMITDWESIPEESSHVGKMAKRVFSVMIRKEQDKNEKGKKYDKQEITSYLEFSKMASKIVAEYECVIRRQRATISRLEKEIVNLKDETSEDGKVTKVSKCFLKTSGVCIHEVLLKNERTIFEKQIVNLKVSVANYMDQVNNLQSLIFREKLN